MMPTDSRPGDKQAPSEPRLICSFCGKNQDQVRTLIAGPSVNICDECVDLCNEILEKESERKSPAGQPPQQGTIFNLEASCALCHLRKPSEELSVVPDRGFICTVCLDAVRAAAESGQEK
jgi:hypothetical protein